MAKQVPKFGDMYSADIILQLSDPDGVGYRGNPVYLHSQLLRKSEFYKAMLSDRWSSDKSRPLKISVTSTHSVEEHIKCIQIMYSCEANKRLCFSSVDDALAILPTASELLFQECVQGCIQYLNAVRWSPVQEVKIRSIFSSLQLNNLPMELYDRLCMNPGKSVGGDLQIFVESIQEMLSTAVKAKEDSVHYRSIVGKCIASYFDASDPTSPVAVACRCLLVKEFSRNVELIKRYYVTFSIGSGDYMTIDHKIAMSYTGHYKSIDDFIAKRYIVDAYCGLLCVVEVIQHCHDTDLFKTVLNMFSYDNDLRFALNCLSYARIETKAQKNLWEYLFNIFLKALGNGEVVTPTSFRVFFLTNWIKTMVLFANKEEATLAREIIDVAETLPMVNKKHIYQIMIEEFRNSSSLTGIALEWWGNTLRDAIASGKITGT